MKRKLCVCVGTLLIASNALSNTAAVPAKMQRALDQATHGTPAVALIVGINNLHLLAVEQPKQAATLQARPGSILKPFFLAGALEQKALTPETTFYCRRSLFILGRNLQCTHPQNNETFNADDALAYSCNTYFANLANRLSSNQAAAILQSYGLGNTSGLFAEETSHELQPPSGIGEKELYVLGLAGISVTPTQVAAAYRKLALKFKNPSSSPQLQVVETGLLHSVQYGMAHNAEVSGLQIAGKTGTASDPGQAWTHGWFAGIVTSSTSNFVIVIYLPRSNGADAALLAHRFLIQWKNEAAR